jgi:hypothetical protein
MVIKPGNVYTYTMTERNIITVIIIIAIIICIVLLVQNPPAFFYRYYPTNSTTTIITTPSQNQITYPQPPIVSTGSCYVGGCSSEICSDQPGALSSCIYNPKNACYKQTSVCTRQNNGQCGWTQTPGLAVCLGN